MSASTVAVMQQWTRKYFRDRDEVYADIYENRQFNAIYLTMLVMAGLIALLGLLINSPAVIIGAMLISPLMGPILSCGLALTLADWDLGKKGFRNVVYSVVEVLLITALVASLSPLKDATPEILARSNPNLMDLLIAFFSGVAGSIALTSKSKSGLTIIPGVAIATAVMPPLATVGYGIATAQWQIARGSFMLFFTNLVAIIISADLVFFLAGFRPRQRVAEGKSPAYVRARGLIALAILIVISIPLIRTLAQAAQQASVRREIQTVLRTLEKPHDVQLGNWRFELEADRVVVDAAVITGKPLEKDVLDQTQRMLSTTLNRPAELHVSQIRVDDGSTRARDFLAGGNLAASVPQPRPPEDVIGDYQNRVQGLLSNLAVSAGFNDVVVDAVGMNSGGSVMIHFTAKRESPAESDVIAVLASALQKDLKHPVSLRGEFLVGRTQLKFARNSERLDRSSAADARKLAELTKGGAESATIAFAGPSPLNDRRVRAIEAMLKVPTKSLVDSSMKLEGDQALVILRQDQSAESTRDQETPAPNLGTSRK